MAHIGIISSSGGAVFAAAIDCLQQAKSRASFFVVTDRPCGIEKVANKHKIPNCRIDDPSILGFGRAAAKELYKKANVDWTCLFFSRLVSSDIYDAKPCINIHPSLLPDFPGFHALEQFSLSGNSILGATAHIVDSTIDSGKIVAQVGCKVPIGQDLLTIRKISFSQKLYLFLLLVVNQNISDFTHQVDYKCLSINDRLPDLRVHDFFISYLKKEGINWGE